MKRNGNAVIEGAFILAAIFTLAIVILNMKKITFDINEAIQNDDDFSNKSQEIMQKTNTQTNVWDSLLMFVFIALWIGALVSAYFIDTHPVFFVLTVIGIGCVLVAAMALEDVWEDQAADDAYSDVIGDLTFIDWIMDNIVAVILILSFSIGVVLYGKFR